MLEYSWKQNKNMQSYTRNYGVGFGGFKKHQKNNNNIKYLITTFSGLLALEFKSSSKSMEKMEIICKQNQQNKKKLNVPVIRVKCTSVMHTNIHFLQNFEFYQFLLSFGFPVFSFGFFKIIIFKSF
jgi:hypothetical protein